MKVYQKPRYHEYRWKTFIAPLIDRDGKDRRVLDLGCNAGFYMRKLSKFGYDTIGVELDKQYINQAPDGFKIICEDVNYYNPTVAFLTLLLCVHYHQTDEQVEALLHNLMYSTLNLIIMGRHHGRTKSRGDKNHLMKKMRRWKKIDEISTDKFYSIIFRNPRYEEFDVDGLYKKTRHFVSTVQGFVDFVPSFEMFVRDVLSCTEFDSSKTKFFKHLKQTKKLYPLGRCWIYKKLIWDIKSSGLNTALKVQDGRISDGFHRLIILRELGVKRVICKVKR